MIEGHALELHLEQAVHRQLAARVAQADDDAVDALAGHDRGDVVDGADDGRVDDRLADACGIGVDEADDLDAEFAAPLVEFARQRDRCGARADQQQVLVRADVARDPLERHPPADHERQDQHRGEQEHAAPDDQVGDHEVDQAEDERAGAKRLQDADEQLAPVLDQAHVVQLGVVQAGLADERDEQALGQRVLVLDQRPRVRPHPDERRERDGAEDQHRLEQDEHERTPREALEHDAGHGEGRGSAPVPAP